MKAISHARATTEIRDMGLTAPGIITFMTSVILTVIAMLTKFFGAQIPFIQGNEFAVLVVAQVVLIAGCLVRSL